MVFMNRSTQIILYIKTILGKKILLSKSLNYIGKSLRIVFETNIFNKKYVTLLTTILKMVLGQV